MQLCEDNGNDRLLCAARREASAARDDLWLVLLVLAGWSTVVALVASTLGGGR
jgi:hypothetical protein